MRKQKVILYLLAIFFLISLIFSLPVFAVTHQYIKARPLTEIVKTSVGICRDNDVTELPLITWGGDIKSILANGNQQLTVKDSIFGKEGLRFKLFREDVFSKQVEYYLSCRSPYLRGTMGMIMEAAEVTSLDPRTAMVVVYQKTWSNGGDTLVVKDSIRTVRDLKGKTIAVNADGPHTDYLMKVLADGGLLVKDVKIVWTKDLTGTDLTPGAAFQNDPSVEAAMMIIPDALALTSGGTVGTGAEGSVKGARILLTTKTANRIIADVYAVRRDYLESHRDRVQNFVHGLMLADEELHKLMQEKESRSAEYKKMITASAEILLDSSQATADAEGLYADAEFVGFAGNVEFFGNPNNLRNFERLTDEIQTAFISLGLLSKKVPVDHARWDYNNLKKDLTNVEHVEVPRFDSAAAAVVIMRKQQQETLAEGELFSFEIYFQPTQNDFQADLYSDAFTRVVELASRYGGALITVEGHSDPLEYLRKKKVNPSDEVALSRFTQAAKNLSFARANAVRDSVVAYARSKNVTMDPSQLVVVGHGFMRPKNGKCGTDPCAPKTEQEWRNNMRVEFRIIQVEAESSVFKPL